MRNKEQIYTEWLIARCRGGDFDAMNQIVEIWNEKFLSFASYKLGKPHVALDIVQDAWLVIVKSLHKLDDPAAFRSWAYRIVANKCSDWFRQKKKQKTDSLDFDPVANESDSNSDQGNAVNMLMQEIGLMSEDQRVLLRLFYLDELSVREIADALEIPEGTVKSRLYHARQELKERLERNES